MSKSIENLLVELLVEELPPKALRALSEAFAEGLYTSLAAQGLTTADSRSTPYASPRRLAVHITAVAARAPDKPVCHKLMPVAVALDAEGRPTPALLKKLSTLGLDAHVVPGLRRVAEGKSEVLYYDSVAPGASLGEGLQKALEATLAKLPIPKVMSYQLRDGWTTVHFVRPAHGLLALYGAEVVPVSVLGLRAGRTTQGHRFEAQVNPVSIEHADRYEAQMEAEGAVIPSFAKRRAEIVRQLAAKATEGLQPVEDAALLDEVTALVERPNVLLGRFDTAFLEVPPECLILTMKANQKYFPLLDAQGRLTNRFLIVANVTPADPSAVIAGNERVVRPRLADAKFFYDQDRSQPLASRVEKLARVVYHNRLGSQLERTRRVQKLAHEIALMLHADAELAARAAWLAKADLTTDMVGEFPELQGIMGAYYARHDGEPEAVCRAIKAHYHPRFAGDTLPEDNIGAAVALADKLETLVGIYGIGAVPTGEKDPYGLRRHALGILRILAEKSLPLDLVELLEAARALLGELVADSVVVDVHAFMLERLRNYLRERRYGLREIDSVLAQNPSRIDLVLPRLEAVVAFVRLPEAQALAAANKRIQNILKKAQPPTGAPEFALFAEDAERALFEAVNSLAPRVRSLVANQDYTGALRTLATVRPAVDRFFDEVMVLTDEPLLRANRLALLKGLAELMNQVADLSKLAG
ncbi:glycine--tRNA ligase subunit beta [Thiobacter aerophilum]|uniref:Glycine--tRNA ligase beta subunit n=1 Tax=Thiobacter aerophilum TaxID=3121275 RepID=A0ABV0EE55_9BURK